MTRSPASFLASNTCSGRLRSKVTRLVMSTSVEIGRRPDRLQPALQPVGRGAVPEAAEMAADHDGAGAVGLGLVAVRPLDRAFVAAGDRVGLHGLQRAEARRRQIAGDAVHAQAIAAVGRHLDLDHRIVEAERLGRRRAGRGLGRQVDDAAMVVAQLQLAEGAQHAVALLAADLARLQASCPCPGCSCRSARRCPSCRCARWARRTRPAPVPLPVSTRHSRSRSALGCCTASTT